jgi:hypothetical protein
MKPLALTRISHKNSTRSSSTGFSLCGFDLGVALRKAQRLKSVLREAISRWASTLCRNMICRVTPRHDHEKCGLKTSL